MKVISRYKECPPTEQAWANNSRTISCGPLYAPSVVQALLTPENIKLMTRKAVTDVAALGLDAEDVAVLLQQALREGKYLTSEWTKISEKVCAACDAYRITRTEEIDDRHLDIAYYIKFAVNDQGALVLVVSCHLSH